MYSMSFQGMSLNGGVDKTLRHCVAAGENKPNGERSRVSGKRAGRKKRVGASEAAAGGFIYKIGLPSLQSAETG